MDWALNHLDRPVQLQDLAERSHLSVRQFVRRFLAATGTSPYAWLLEQRVRRAQELLETTQLPIEGIARQAGFGSPAVLRLHFRRHLDTSPRAYRATFDARTS